MVDIDAEDSSLPEAARAIRAAIFAARHETEERRCLAPSVVELMQKANLFRLAVPRAHGGLEANPLYALDVYEELAGVEASAAWLTWNNTLPALMSRHSSPEVRHALFSEPGTFMANSTRPTGRAHRIDGGYRVQGRWSLVSGCELARHLLLRCVVVHDGDTPVERPELVMTYVPKRECRVVDTWNAGGLRGTGSHDVLVADTFVPASYAVSFAQPVNVDGALYKMPFAARLSAGCASIALGIARASLQCLTAILREKVSVDSGRPAAEHSSSLSALAQMTAQRAAAHLLLRAETRAAWIDCVRGEAVTLEQRAALWGAARHAAQVSKDVVRRAYELAGASALYADCPLERAHRDIHAVAQHIILTESWLEDAGRVQLGSAPVNPMFAS